MRPASDAPESLRVGFSPLDAAASLRAADAWRAHRRARGSPGRVVADILIGAHATLHADRLLTRDRGVYRRCFEQLTIMDPAA